MTLTVVPWATSNLHSDPLARLIWVGGAGVNSVSTEVCARSRPGRDMVSLFKELSMRFSVEKTNAWWRKSEGDSQRRSCFVLFAEIPNRVICD